MIIGAIDVGSNSIKYLVASVRRGRVRKIAVRSDITRLSGGLDRTNALSAAAQERTLAVLRRFARDVAGHGARKIVAVGTEALRVARNGKSFAARCLKEAGVPVRIISGREEARLAYLGATGGRREKRIAAIDIGGGSTEFMVGSPGRLRIDVSVPLGAVRLTEKHFASDPPALVERLSLFRAVHEGLERLPRRLAVAIGRAGTFLGIGGTCVNVARMVHPRGDPEGRRVPLETLESILDGLAELTLARRKRVPGIDPARADIIIAGARILVESLKAFDIDGFTATTRGLRHGLILSLS